MIKRDGVLLRGMKRIIRIIKILIKVDLGLKGTQIIHYFGQVE